MVSRRQSRTNTEHSQSQPGRATRTYLIIPASLTGNDLLGERALSELQRRNLIIPSRRVEMCLNVSIVFVALGESHEPDHAFLQLCCSPRRRIFYMQA